MGCRSLPKFVGAPADYRAVPTQAAGVVHPGADSSESSLGRPDLVKGAAPAPAVDGATLPHSTGVVRRHC